MWRFTPTLWKTKWLWDTIIQVRYKSQLYREKLHTVYRMLYKPTLKYSKKSSLPIVHYFQIERIMVNGVAVTAAHLQHLAILRYLNSLNNNNNNNNCDGNVLWTKWRNSWRWSLYPPLWLLGLLSVSNRVILICFFYLWCRPCRRNIKTSHIKRHGKITYLGNRNAYDKIMFENQKKRLIWK